MIRQVALVDSRDQMLIYTHSGAVSRYAPEKKVLPGPQASPFGLSNLRANRSYGIACCPIWNENDHPNEKKYWDSWEGVWRFKSINWIIKKVHPCDPTLPLRGEARRMS